MTGFSGYTALLLQSVSTMIGYLTEVRYYCIQTQNFIRIYLTKVFYMCMLALTTHCKIRQCHQSHTFQQNLVLFKDLQ